MKTLQELRDEIDAVIKSNPLASDYKVATFDYFRSKTNPCNKVVMQWLVTDKDGNQRVYDNAQELNESQYDETFHIEKVYLL